MGRNYSGVCAYELPLWLAAILGAPTERAVIRMTCACNASGGKPVRFTAIGEARRPGGAGEGAVAGQFLAAALA